jgi:hypothetical protein
MIDQASTTQRRTVSSLVLLLGLGAVFVAAGLAALYQPLEATASDVGMSYLKPSNLPCGHVISIAARGSGRVWAKPTNCGAGWMMKAHASFGPLIVRPRT